MFKINLYCVGNLKDKEYISMCQEYQKRISRFAKINVIEIKEKTNLDNIQLIIENESKDISSKLDLTKACLFDVKGEMQSSEQLADFLKSWFNTNSELNFIIGGSYGVSNSIKHTVSKKLSISKMTFPHRLFRVMALEQIYRALTILNNVNYHK